MFASRLLPRTAFRLLGLFILLLALAAPANAQVPSPTWLAAPISGDRPSPRLFAGAGNTYDESNDRLIVYGGANVAGPLSDIWVLTNATGADGTPGWQALTPANVGPGARSLHTAVYDAASNRLIVHGGCGGACGPYFADTWALTNANGLGGTPEWIQLPDGPRVRNGHAAVYDPTTNRMIVFGGGQTTVGSDGNDVAVLTDANGLGNPQWLTLNPIGTPPPPIGATASAVYDTSSNRLMLIAGRDGFGVPYNHVWALTNANGLGGTPEWIQLTPTGALPAPRGLQILAYDQQTNRAIVFGGGDGNVTSYNDVWVLKHANGLGGLVEWQQLMPTGGAPASRYGGIGGYSSRTNRLIVTEGQELSSNLLLDDVWTLTNANGILYTFLGFYAPVDNLPIVNRANAGQAIPIKWSLKDANGQYVSDLGAISSYGFGSLPSCDGNTDAIEEYAGAATTSLRYDFSSNQFILNAKTDKSWAGSCKVFTVLLADGSQYQARFTFTK